MKLLTFAFVIQFIIACWPKIDIKTIKGLDQGLELGVRFMG